MTKADALRRMLLMWLPGVAAAVAGCHSFREESGDGPGMILEYGNLIGGKSIVVKSAVLPDGKPFMDPGALGGSGLNKKRPTWKDMPTKVMAASGDHRGLPDWVAFEWSEPPYPEDPNMSLEAYRALPRKKHRLVIKSRIPESVIKEVAISKREAPRGKVADKTLWIYIFWTPDGMKMRWEMTNRAAGPGGFGPVIKEGGDDLDRYNL